VQRGLGLARLVEIARLFPEEHVGRVDQCRQEAVGECPGIVRQEQEVDRHGGAHQDAEQGGKNAADTAFVESGERETTGLNVLENQPGDQIP
jgi:hypothetical protein